MQKCKKGKSLQELNAILNKWQKDLILDDWKLSLEIVNFKRKDFRQSGDIKVYPRKKSATVLLTDYPYLDEEETIVHELMHLILWDFDIFCEKIVLENSDYLKGRHGRYMYKLEDVVERLTRIAVNKIV